jgi:hypothetical protein
MQLTTIISFLITPGKNIIPIPAVQGTSIATTGKLHQMLLNVFDKSDVECFLPIRFVMSPEGKQENPARDLIISFCNDPSMDNGQSLAERLCAVTTNKSGLGLLFIMLGFGDQSKKLVLSRFPADQGIVAETSKGNLTVEFIEQIFMKSSAFYKAATYTGISYDQDFWHGLAVDKQLNTSTQQAANYWIREFLASDFVTTSEQGTKRFAIALRDASRSTQDASIKHEIFATSMLSTNLNGQSVSINNILERYQLSKAAKECIVSKLSYEDLANDAFVFDNMEFLSHAAFASVELNNGGILMAPPDTFNNVFVRERLPDKELEYSFKTEGKIIEERIRGKR